MGKGGYNGGSTVIHAGSGWMGKGSVTTQRPGKKATFGKSGSQKKVPRNDTSVPKKGSGLTLAEIMAKAQRRVRTLEIEISKTKRLLVTLERSYTQALIDVENVRSMPRKTAAGAALHQAQKQSLTEAPKPSVVSKTQMKASKNAERIARENYRNAPKEVEVEHRIAGVLVAKRLVKRS